MQVTPHADGVDFTLVKEKAEKWMDMICKAIDTAYLDSGSAQKLSGRLSWATQKLFHRLGRAMIKAIFAQKASANGCVGARLMMALKWWRRVLSKDICERKRWDRYASPPCRLFVDAASTPARVAAVLFKGADIWYTDGAPCEQLVSQLLDRNDKQITSLVRFLLCPGTFACSLLALVQEIIAIMVALSTFSHVLQGEKVVLYSDNKGAEAITSKGSARAFDHNALVHEIWSHAFLNSIHLWIERVPSKFNISDSPSRFRYKILENLRARWCKPVMAALHLGEVASAASC